jgi:hypothetical protein
MRLENLEKTLEGRSKTKICTTYYKSWIISTKTSRTSHGAFFKQHPKFDIIFLDILDGAEKIELNKGENIKLDVMKEL